MEIQNGIAYSGDKKECGTLKQKINHAIENKIGFIQVRAADIQDLIHKETQSEDVKKVQDLITKYQKTGGKLSVHLPNPVWDKNLELISEHDKDTKNPDNPNVQVIGFIKTALKPIGVDHYTIHPHFSRVKWEEISAEEQRKVLERMAKYFSKISQLGVTLAIENIPVRNLKEIKEKKAETKEEQAKLDKALKNISYGMTIEEIDDIIELSREDFAETTGSMIDAKEQIGMTYDTGHSLAEIKEEDERMTEIDKWVNHFQHDIRIFHISPSGGDEATKNITNQVFDCCQKYNVQALSYIEAHNDLQTMAHYHQIGCECKENNHVSETKSEHTSTSSAELSV